MKMLSNICVRLCVLLFFCASLFLMSDERIRIIEDLRKRVIINKQQEILLATEYGKFSADKRVIKQLTESIQEQYKVIRQLKKQLEEDVEYGYEYNFFMYQAKL